MRSSILLAAAAVAASFAAIVRALPTSANGLCSYNGMAAMVVSHGAGQGMMDGAIKCVPGATPGTYSITISAYPTYTGIDLWVADGVDGTHVGSFALPSADFSYNPCGPNAQSTVMHNSDTDKTLNTFVWTADATVTPGKPYFIQAVVVEDVPTYVSLTPFMIMPTNAAAAAPAPAPVAAPAPAPAVAPPMPAGTAQCGPMFGNAKCAAGLCCSQYGWCGGDAAYCGAGCMPAFGACSTATMATNVSTNGMCGPGANTRCPTGQCCSQYGWCGNSAIHCAAGTCQTGFGTCGPTAVIAAALPPAAAFDGAAAAAGRCGPGVGGCPGQQCCSVFGYCGSSAIHCGVGCQAGFGTCTA